MVPRKKNCCLSI